VRSAPVLPDGWTLVALASVGSTNDEAARLADAGAPEGTVVWSREQTGGRGRRGRHWASPVGNLYSSTILRPDCAAPRAAELPPKDMSTSKIGNAAAGVGAATALSQVNEIAAAAKEVKGNAQDLGLFDAVGAFMHSPGFRVALTMVIVIACGAIWYWRREHARAGV